MRDNPENDLPASASESELINQVVNRLVQAANELQAFQSIQPDSQPADPARLQALSTDLQSAVDTLTHLDLPRREDGTYASGGEALDHGAEAYTGVFPSAADLSALRKRAEQIQSRKEIDINALSKEEIQNAFHELEVHQVELRMQNEELLRVQMELETACDRFSSLYNFAPAGYCTIDKKGLILEANATLHRLLHVPAGALIHTNIQHYILEQEQDRFYLYLRAAIGSSGTHRCELMMGTGENDRFIAQLESRIAPGQADQVWLVVSDISKSRRAAEFTARYEAVVATLDLLKIERNRYRNLFDFAPDGYVVTDRSGTILDVNQAGAALFGAAKDGLVGTPLVNFILKEQRVDFQSRFEAILKKQSVVSPPRFGEWEIYLASDGREPFPAAVTTLMLQENGGSPVQILWLFRDVSIRKQTEAESGKNMARFRALFEESSIGIRLLDLQGSTIACNAAMQEILGYTEDELRQIPFTQLTEPLDKVKDESGFYSVVSGEIDRYTIEKRCIRKDGKLVWVHQVVFLVRDAANAPAFLVAMIENISERKEMESELAEVRRHLIDMPEVERLMLSQELHDGPMQDLYGVFYNIKSLEAKLSGGDAEIIKNSADTINQVVHVLRGFAGQLRPPTLKSSGLEKTIRSYAIQFQEEHPQIKISLDLMPDGHRLPERVSLALFRIFQQSLANIVRHAHATRVNIYLFIDEQRLELRIEDDGDGFEVPTRLVDLVREGHYGLVGSVERAEAIGGVLTIDSKPGIGTTIFVNMNLK